MLAQGLNRFLIRELSAIQLGWIALALTFLSACYCVIYTNLAGRGEPLSEGIVWALLNLVPWLVCFELTKRMQAWVKSLAIIALFLVGMAAIDSLWSGSDLGFELTRRLPGAIMVGVMHMLALLLKHLLAERARDQQYASADTLPLLVDQISWVVAAGNYVELHGAGTPVLHRAPISAVEKLLAPHDFIRIHRSTIVRRCDIVDHTGDTVKLRDGQIVKVGSRYRTALD